MKKLLLTLVAVLLTGGAANAQTDSLLTGLTGEQTPCETYEADAERSNPEKWITPIEFHTRLENKYPWLS